VSLSSGAAAPGLSTVTVIATKASPPADKLVISNTQSGGAQGTGAANHEQALAASWGGSGVMQFRLQRSWRQPPARATRCRHSRRAVVAARS
jgi:hypothetical protein